MILLGIAKTVYVRVSQKLSIIVRSACLSLAPSLVLFSVLLLVLTMLTEKLSFVFFGPIDVVPRSDELYFVFDPVDLFSSTGTLLRLIISIYNSSYLQYYYIHNSILRIKSVVEKLLKGNIQRDKNYVHSSLSKSFEEFSLFVVTTVPGSYYFCSFLILS